MFQSVPLCDGQLSTIYGISQKQLFDKHELIYIYEQVCNEVDIVVWNILCTPGHLRARGSNVLMNDIYARNCIYSHILHLRELLKYQFYITIKQIMVLTVSTAQEIPGRKEGSSTDFYFNPEVA